MAKLSVLDLSFVTSGHTGADALRDTLDLAPFVERLGYTRYWVAEHHNLPSVASAAPDIMIGQIAAATRHMRVGAGGVMLPNHAPLMVAERFKLLAALFPGRIDLGLGRAPGTDPMTSHALRRRQVSLDDPEQDFLDRLQELIFFETRAFPDGHPYRNIWAMPADAPLPPLWLLGSSGYSAELAAQIGSPFAFAQHFATHDAAAALRSYRERFHPSRFGSAPYAILTVAAIAASTDEEAEWLASSADLSALRRRRSEFGPVPSPEEAAAETYSDADRAFIRANRERLFVGSAAKVKEAVDTLASACGADEIMILTAVHDHEARKRSYALLAQAYGLTPPSDLPDKPS